MPRKPRGWKAWFARSGSNWRTRWTGRYGTGQQVFVLKDDARDLVRDKKRDFQRMDAGQPALTKPSSAITVAAWAATYLSNSKAEKSARTHNNFDKPAITSFSEMHGNLALVAVTDQHVRDWKAAMAGKYGPTTSGMHFAQVCAFFNAAVRAGEISKSPARYVVKPVRTGGGRELRDEELVALMALAPEKLFKTGKFSLNTLCRISEVCIFDWAWVWELEDGEWMGRIPAELRKTKAKVLEDCIFPINSEARSVMGLRRLSGRVFPWAPVTIQQQLTATRRLAKLPEDVTFHCFRHTGASRFLRKTGHMEDLLKSHIWEDPRSLLRYVHLDHKVLHRRFSEIDYSSLAPKREKPSTQSQG